MANDDVLLVPVTAVSKERNDNYVWLYDDETQKIKQVRVKLGNADAKQQKIASGLKEVQKVITKAENPLRMERH
ncbi:MAG: efflux RND transporter periplasmic adaptor subunit [Streptococcus salivarius]